MIKQACRFVSLVADDVKANDVFITTPCGKEIGVMTVQDSQFVFKILNNGNVVSTNKLSIPPGTNFGDYMYWDTQSNKWKIEGDKIRLGRDAGKNQGQNSIAIGAKAGFPNQGSNSIILNATGQSLSGDNSSLYISPIRKETSTNQTRLSYNPTTKEVTYNDTGIYLAGNNLLPSSPAIQIGSTGSYINTAYIDKLVLNDSIYVDTPEGRVPWNRILTTNSVTIDKLSVDLQNKVSNTIELEKRILALEEYVKAMEKTYILLNQTNNTVYKYTGRYQSFLVDNFSITFKNKLSSGGVVIEVDEYTYNTFPKSLSVYDNSGSLLTMVTKGVIDPVNLTVNISFPGNSNFPLQFKLLDPTDEVLFSVGFSEANYSSLPIA